MTSPPPQGLPVSIISQNSLTEALDKLTINVTTTMHPDDGAKSPSNKAQLAQVNSVENGEPTEHPDAPAIRRQVEFYFSDENLPTDLHMLQCCGGHLNLPVSINRICGFKRMREYKPKRIVVEALKKSAFLDVVEDGKMVKRKVPLAEKTMLDGDSDEEIAYDPRSKLLEKVVPKTTFSLLRQVRKEIPPGKTKNMMKPSGFEPTYAEGPITPAQAEEDNLLYNTEKPFIERIENAIQRFKQKRKMHEMYSKVFNKWMRFGGVDCSPRMFANRPSQQEIAEMDVEERVRTLATHNVPRDREDPSQWVVDFEGLAKGSSFYPDKFGHNENQIKTACQVLRSFYNYILLHNVCPEYEADILAARKVCDLAEKELHRCFQAGQHLPGKFNTAASTLFGGYHAGLYVGDAEWAQAATVEWEEEFTDIGMKDEEAQVVFKTGVVVYGTDELYEAVHGEGIKSIKLLHKETVGLTLSRIQRATSDVLEIYAQQNKAWAHKLPFQTLGKMFCTPFKISGFEQWDLPKGYKFLEPMNQEYEFWVEDETLDMCFEGMKMRASVMHFSHGITVLDSVGEVHPSFYEYLPNELWMVRKPKIVKLLKRGAEAEAEAE
ncbi:hypothetical protein GQ43DRAFT_401278, partial [Delitschia confertaspora ATCC 74209]